MNYQYQLIMAKKSAICGEHIITVEDSGTVNVYRISDNTKDSLREIAKTIGFEYDETWNTRTLGSKLVDFINGKTIDQPAPAKEVEQQDSNINEEETNVQDLKELCNRIKEALESQGRDSFITKSEEEVYTDEPSDDPWKSSRPNDNQLTEDIDEGIYFDHILDENILCRYESEDEDYCQEMRVNGVFIEDDELKFYLQEYRESDVGCEPYFDSLVVDFEGLMNGWWIEYADDFGYNPKNVLSKFLEVITEIMPELEN